MRTVVELIKAFLCGHRWTFSERLPGGVVRVRCIRCKAEKVERV